MTIAETTAPNMVTDHAPYNVMNGVYIKAGETSGNSCTVTDITPNYAYKLVVTSCVNGELSVPSDENAVYFMKTVEPEGKILLGDLNGDGKLDDKDISMMKAKLAENDSTFEKIHDVNEDTYFDIRNLSALIYTIDHLAVT